MSKMKSLKVTLFNADPNKAKYKGRKGMVIDVVHGDIGDTPTERWEWRMRYFDPNDRVNGAFDRLKMEALISEGWQEVTPTSLAHWELVEKDGIKFGSDEGFIKLF
jgi:hypothetical protein